MAALGITLQRLTGSSAKAAVPIFVLLVLVMMLVPLPPIVLDLLFTLSIGISILVLIAAINIRNFKDFIAFQEEHGWAVEYEAVDLDDEDFEEDTEEEEIPPFALDSKEEL